MTRKHLIHLSVIGSLAIAAAVIATFYFLQVISSSPKAVKGVVDLSHWDFNVDGSASLTGQWGHISSNGSSRDYDYIPSVFGADTTIAIYSLIIKLPEGHPGKLSLFLPYMYSSYQLFIDGKAVINNGRYSDSGKLEWVKEIASFTPQGDSVKLVVFVNNDSYLIGGMPRPISLGTAEAISKLDNLKLAQELAYLIIFIMIGLFNFSFVRASDFAPFWMGVYCLQIAIYGATFHERLFLSLFDLNWDLILKIQYINAMTCLVSFHYFLKHSFNGRFNNIVDKMLLIVTSAQVLVVVFSPSSVYAPLLAFVFGPALLIVCVNAIVVFYVEAIKGAKYALLNLIGFSILAIASLGDFLSNVGALAMSTWIAEGLIFYICLQALIVKSRYQESLEEAEKLNSALSRNNTELLKSKDIIEEKMIEVVQAREEADRALVSKTRFLALISHELRSPITSSYQLIESLEDMSLDNKRAETFVRLSLETMNPVFNLLEDIIDFSTIEYNSTLKVTPKPFDLTSVINNIYLTHTKLAEEKNIKIELNHCNSKISKNMAIFTDQTRLRQVLSNFIVNAIKYTPRSGRINVYYRVQESPVAENGHTHLMYLEVTDNGIGIDETETERIFEMFHQVESSDDNVQVREGFGLGLPLCKVIVEEMKGTISVKSKLGKGSTFIAEIPVSFCDKRKTSLPFDRIRISNVAVLLVEDDPSIQFTTSTLLRNVGVTVDVASNAEEALQFYQSKIYDIAFIDCYLPGINGFDLTRQIRQWETSNRHSRIPVIGLSASPLQNVIDAAMDSGMNDFMGKPYKKIELYNMINWHKNYKKEVNSVLT